MGESVEGALGEDRVVEERDPLVDGAVAGDDGRGAPVPLEDDLVEVARLAGIEATQAEVVEDEDVGGQEPAQHLLAAVVGPRLVQSLEHVVGAQEEDVVAGPAGGVAEGRGEVGLSDPDRAEEDHVLAALDEAEAEELPHPLAVEADRRVPVEAFEGLLLLEAGAGEAEREILLVAARDLVVQGELQEVELSELRLPRIGDPLGERREQAPELEPLHRGPERLADLHRSSSFRGG